jgi:hypothetical protein
VPAICAALALLPGEAGGWETAHDNRRGGKSMTDHDRSSNRQYDEETHGRRRLERGFGDRDDEMRGGLGDEERWRMEARDSWRQRERASEPAGGRDWQQPRDPYYGGSPRFVGERGGSQWSPRGDYGQGGYWESEGSSQGGQRGQGRQDYSQRGSWGQPDRQDYGQGGPWGRVDTRPR